MNTQHINLFKAISSGPTKELNTVTNETLVSHTQQEKTFTAADLWNIQRQKRSIMPRRYYA